MLMANVNILIGKWQISSAVIINKSNISENCFTQLKYLLDSTKIILNKNSFFNLS